MAAHSDGKKQAGQHLKVEPFLRWAGGKRQLVSQLVELAPGDAASRRYVEPFLGAASLYFALAPKSALLGDANSHLMGCYRAIRDRPRRVAALLRRHATLHSEEHYYRVRSLYNRSGSSAAQAARFIYLNQSCYNGVFRVNKLGKFNVPYGDKDSPNLPSASKLLRIAQQLRGATLVAGDFANTLASVRRGDFVYLDPPYPPLNGTAFFAHYTMDRFSQDDQERLADLVRALHERGCVIMLSNAGVQSVSRLYTGFTFHRLSVTRYVTCKKQKHRVREVVITNY